METWPLAPTGTLTRFGRVSPAPQLRLEVTGRAWPAGQTVSRLDALVLVTVTLRTTPMALAGTPVLPPATVRLRDPPAPSVVCEILVSRIRLGLCAVYAEPGVAFTCWVSDPLEAA